MNGQAPVKKDHPKEAANPIRIEPWKPSRKFSEYIRAFKVMRLAEEIQVQRHTVYKWLNGIQPPNRNNAAAIVMLSTRTPLDIGPLTYDDILIAPGKQGGCSKVL